MSQALNPAQQIIKIVHEELVDVLGGEARRLQFAKQPPTVIMLAGLQGSGKTTLAGKLARWLKGQGHQPLLVAADLQRPNAVNQLQVLGGRAGVEVYAPEPGNGVGDPVQVARDSIEHARRHDARHRHRRHRRPARHRRRDDGAGRATSATRSSPTRSSSSSTRWSARTRSRTAEAFRDGVGITGVVLSKLDGDARGGAALSVREVTGQPILFASTGEKLEDFDVFHPDRMASRILGMGDVLTLIEQAEPAFDADQKEKMTAKLIGGEQFTLEDFLDQLIARAADGPDRQRAGHDARHGPDEGPARRARRQALRPGHRDHPVDDAGRAHQPEDHQRLAPGPHRQRLRRHRHGRQPAAQPLRRRAEDDEADGRHDGPARRRPAQGDQVAEEQAQGHQGRQPAAYRRRGMPGGFPGGMPQLPPGLDPSDLAGGQGLPPGFKLPKLDFNKLGKARQAAPLSVSVTVGDVILCVG